MYHYRGRIDIVLVDVDVLAESLHISAAVILIIITSSFDDRLL